MDQPITNLEKLIETREVASLSNLDRAIDDMLALGDAARRHAADRGLCER